MIWIGIGLILAIIVYSSAKGWIKLYNKFIYWRNKVNGKFANIDIIIQQRVDMINALAQVVKKYDIHEYKTLKSVIEARSRWTKDTDINEKIQNTEKLENNFFKLQAVFEKYPKLKADALHKSIMGRGNVSKVESKLKKYRLEYNRAVRMYNERVQRFPRNIVALIHGFKEFEYLNFANQEEYKPKEIFED